MVKGQAYIDGIDISSYGITLCNDDYNDLLKFPDIKDIKSNDWVERDGIEADLTNIRLSTKEILIKFVATSITSRDNDFIAVVTSPGYHEFNIPVLERTWKLRVASESDRNIYRNGKTFGLKFIDDFPRDILGHQGQISGHGIPALPTSRYALDGIYLNEYGIVVENGRSEIEKMPSLKTNLERNITIIDGIQYDVDMTTFQSKDVKLECCFLCDTLDRLWNNYIAFFSNLIKDGERKLYVDYKGESFTCFYKQSDNFRYIRNSQIKAVKFELTLTFTQFRVNETEYLLAAEDGTLLITEDSAYFIDMN